MPASVFAQYRLTLAVLACAALYVAAMAVRPVKPAFPAVTAALQGGFTRDGQFRGEPLADAEGVRTWGSWSGADANTGACRFGPFPAPPRLRFAVGGYPTQPGNRIALVLSDTGERAPISVLADVGERWRITDFDVPAGWDGKLVTLVATDDATGFAGWLAVTEPLRGGWGSGHVAFVQMLAAWAITGLLLALPYFGLARWLARRQLVEPYWVPLLAGAGIATAGYLAFWAYFAAAIVGKLFAAAFLAAGALLAWREARTPGPGEAELDGVPAVMLAIGFFYVALLHLIPSSLEPYALAANRFAVGLQGDNTLPHNIARDLYHGVPLRVPGSDWLSSDRPPLQSGWQLLTWPVGQALGLNDRVASDAVSIWFQLLWVAAAYGLLRTLGLEGARARAWIAVLALSGFHLVNTVFTWPKMAAGAFACGAFALWVLPRKRARGRGEPPAAGEGAGAAALTAHAESRPAGDACADRQTALGAALAALAWLAHGGAAFSFLALAPWILWRCRRGEWRRWGLAAATFAALTLPWTAYQQFYDPPANRLLKWHLAGQVDKDPRGTWQTIRENYARLPARAIWETRLTNLAVQVRGDWRSLFEGHAAGAEHRREDEFYKLLRALTWWGAALAVLPLLLARRKEIFHASAQARLAGWIVLTVVLWCLLMFRPYHAVIHQGSYAVVLGLFVLCCTWLEAAGRWTILAVAALQAFTLATTWAGANRVVHGPPTGWPFVVLGSLALALLLVQGFRNEKSPAPL